MRATRRKTRLKFRKSEIRPYCGGLNPIKTPSCVNLGDMLNMIISFVVIFLTGGIGPLIGLGVGVWASNSRRFTLLLDQRAPRLPAALRKVGIVFAGAIQIWGYPPNSVFRVEVLLFGGAGALVFGMLGAVVKLKDISENPVLGALVGAIYGSVSAVSGLVSFTGVAAV